MSEDTIRERVELGIEWGFYLNADDLDAGLTYDQLTAEWRKRINELKRERANKLLALANAGLDDSWQEEDA